MEKRNKQLQHSQWFSIIFSESLNSKSGSYSCDILRFLNQVCHFVVLISSIPFIRWKPILTLFYYYKFGGLGIILSGLLDLCYCILPTCFGRTLFFVPSPAILADLGGLRKPAPGGFQPLEGPPRATRRAP